MRHPRSREAIGWPNPTGNDAIAERDRLRQYLDLKLTALGMRSADQEGSGLGTMAADFLEGFRERQRLLSDHRCPVDLRIQQFLQRHLGAAGASILLPGNTLILDRHSLARELSLPADGDHHKSPLLESYRLHNGVLHNPRSDRRTTQGVFHIAEGGLPIPHDKKAVPLAVFAKLCSAALMPPHDLMLLPYTAADAKPSCCWVSLYLRPLVKPAVPGRSPELRMETRFFVPGSLVCNLDFVESVFGNAGDPYLPENDAGLEPETWTGSTGCVILAPHLTGLKKKDLGLPHVSAASERQKHDGMCWEKDDELYNDGQAFKICVRNEEGIIVTLIADNYFGYCKKEVKTQIGYSANLLGCAEEEHAGGALAFPRYVLGDEFSPDSRVTDGTYTLDEARRVLGQRFVSQPEGHGVDRDDPSILYVPEDVRISLREQTVNFSAGGQKRSLKLMHDRTYVHPSGYRVHLEKHPAASSWRLVGTEAEGTFCHKPSTVSGGGKSEISKNLTDAIIYGPVYINEVDEDLALVERIITKDYSDRFLPHLRPDRQSRPILSDKRTLGSVIKMLTPSEDEFTPEYNAWLRSIPNHIRGLVFTIKRFYRSEWGSDWRSHFSVDIVNGQHGHELKYEGRKLVSGYLRIGITEDGNWRTYKLRQDFLPAYKIQMEDDITASTIVPADAIAHRNPQYANPSLKIAENCEFRLFQRPDDAIHRGYDHQAEADMGGEGNFISNFEPLSSEQAKELVEDAIAFDKWTEPMQQLLQRAAAAGRGYVVSSAHPRIVNGRPTKNPRYLQVRPDASDARGRRLADVSMRLRRRVPASQEVVTPVSAVLAGRRNNPRETGVRPLAVYNPIHYQELPELFMDFVCSLTGKSPSTTGAGSEGALTKAPFNALLPAADINNALVGMILCNYHGYTSAAGYIGHMRRIDHDISLLVPELWARLQEHERDPAWLIKHGFLEKLNDFEFGGRSVLASRLGYRITARFCHQFLGRIFDNPASVFDEAMLKPETQGLEDYIDGIDNIVEAQQRVAHGWFEDGSVEQACPPLAAIIHIMAHGHFEGKQVDHPEIRALFTRESLVASDWYRERLLLQQQRDIARTQKQVAYLRSFLGRASHASEAARLDVAGRLQRSEKHLTDIQSLGYLRSLAGTIGADPLAPITPAVAGGNTVFFNKPG